MEFQRVDHFDRVKLYDSLVYATESPVQLEIGKVVYKDSVRFDVSWSNSPNDIVTYHAYEDPMSCWELWIVKV